MSVAKSILNLYNTPEGKPGLMTPDELCAYLNPRQGGLAHQELQSPHHTDDAGPGVNAA